MGRRLLPAHPDAALSNGARRVRRERLAAIIDAFGGALATHLVDEIPTLLALAGHRDKLFEKEAQEITAAASKTLAMAFLVTNLDASGVWRNFPSPRGSSSKSSRGGSGPFSPTAGCGGSRVAPPPACRRRSRGS